MKYFVWIQGLRGPEAQKWAEDQTVDGKPVPFLAKHILTPLEANMELKELMNRYSAPIEEKP